VNPEEYSRMYELEGHYWWFVGRRGLALRLLGKALRRSSPREWSIVDLGCGTGVALREMSAWSKPIGIDVSPIALSFCRNRGLRRLLRAEGETIPLKSDSVDAILALDVFEHILEHEQAFSEAHRILEPGGVLVLNVPAFQKLWGPHDVALMHHRRYTRKELRELLEHVGFRIEKLSYAVFFLFPAVVVVRHFERRRKGPAKATLVRVPRWMNRALIWLQTLEAWVIEAIPLPIGSSVVAVARKVEASNNPS
jgi:SAM-dependent methyltransferase